MARPSNRGMEQVDNEKEGNYSSCFYTAIYIRLSYESYYTDSESIENQKLLLREYLQKHKEFVLREEYIDDGKTGTNFERPAFERMMKAVREGAINCIVVKDLSRFGRNHTEVGDYIERIFPFLGIRFISVNDGYDSFHPSCDKDQLLLSVKNLMHEMYARDVSKKISSSIKIKQKTGKFYRTARVPYGYKMGVLEYEIDEQTAEVVRRIFSNFAYGDTVYHICSILNREGIASPGEYATNKLLYAREETDSCWLVSTVERMLKNEVYIGSMVRHKTEQELYNNKQVKSVDQEDWIRVLDTHPAIIDKAIFEQVQMKLMQRKLLNRELNKDKKPRKTEGKEHYKKYHYDENVFKNKIFCADCKAAMIRVNIKIAVKKDKLIYKGFSCGLHRNSVSRCSHKKIIEEDVLCNIVNKMVVDQMNLCKGIHTLVRKNGEDIFNKKRVSITADKRAILYTIHKYEKAKFTALDEYHQGKIHKTEVMMRRSEIQDLIIQCNEQNQLLDERLLKVEKLEEAYCSLMYAWLRYTQNSSILKEMIPLFIERIDVYSGKRIIITMKNTDFINDIVELACKGGRSNGGISDLYEVVERGL